MAIIRKRRPEDRLRTDVIAAIGSAPGLLLMVNDVQPAVKPGTDYPVLFGLGEGSPDLVGILAPKGRWFCLELKSDHGRLEELQARVHGIWRSFGALVYVVRSVEDAKAALLDARGRA